MIDRTVRFLVQRLLSASGRTTAIDPDITAVDLLGEVRVRGIELLRGMLRMRQFVFLGARVKIRGRRHLALARGCAIGEGSIIDARGVVGVKLGTGSRLGRNGLVTTTSHLSKYGVGLRIGRNSGVGDGFHFGAAGGVYLGDDVIIGPSFNAHSQEHVYEGTDKPIRLQGTTEAPVVVGDNCWIGSRVTLLSGTTLGDGTVVASGAVVKGNFPSRVIIGGIPARVLRELPSTPDG